MALYFFLRSQGSPKGSKVLFENNNENKENISSNVSVNYDDVENEKAPQKKKRHPLSDGAGSNYKARW